MKLKIVFLYFYLISSIQVNAQNIGIGTTTPQTALHIVSGSDEALRLVANNPFLSLYSAGVPVGNFGKALNSIEVSAVPGTFLPITFTTEGIQRMFIGSDGLIGIGTISPGASLDVARGAPGSVTANFHGSANISHFNFGTDEDTYIRAGKNNRNVILNDIPGGKVGIGLSSPTAKLSVSADGNELAGTASSNTLRINAGILGTSAGDEISLANIGYISSNNSSLGIRAYRRSAGTDWTSTAFLIGNDVDNTVRAGGGFIALSANGNIGIGVADPGVKLDIAGRMKIRYGPDGEAGVWLNNTANTNIAAFMGLENDTYVGLYGGGAGWKFVMNTQTGGLKINGTEGTAGQVLISNGTGNAAGYTTIGNVVTSFIKHGSGSAVLLYNLGIDYLLPQLSHTITLTRRSRIIISGNLSLYMVLTCTGCGDPAGRFKLKVNGALVSEQNYTVSNASFGNASFCNYMVDLNAGTHTIEFFAMVYAGQGHDAFGRYSSVIIMPVD